MMWAEGSVILDEYEVVRELGSGGMATAYLVRHVDRGQLLAVKVPHLHLVESAEDRMNFASEVQTWIGLPQHPHIVECFFVREVDGLPVVFAEYVPSGTLAGWTERGRIHGLAHVLDLGIQLAEAMNVAHGSGVLHRDLKPANCLMDNSGILKVGDFGVAAARAKSVERRDPVVGSGTPQRRLRAGSPAYCSPEQYDGRPEDRRTDIWSYGVTLFEILTGNRPGLGPAAPSAVRRYLASHPDSTIPPEIWRFLLRLLEPDPARRPESFAQVGSQLRELYAAATGRSYARQFPQPTELGDERTSVPGSRSRTALAYLKRALQFAGRDVSEAARFDVAHPGSHRSEEADLLAAVSILNEATRLYRQTPTAEASEQRMMELAGALQQTAEAQRRLGNLTAAVAAFGEAAAELRTLYQRRPTPHVALSLATVIQDRAVCQRQSGNVTQAVVDYGTAIDEMSRLDACKHDPALANMLAGLYQNRGMAFFKAQRLADAMTDAGRAIELREHLVNELGKLEYATDLAASCCNRGVLHRNMGNTRAALDDYTRAAALCERPGASGRFNRNDEVLSQVLLNRSALNMATNDCRAAVRDADQAIEILERLARELVGPERLLNLSMAYNNRAEAGRQLGDIAGSQRDLDRCIQIREQLVEQWGMTSLANTLARAYYNRVLQLISNHDYSSALPVAERAVVTFESHVHRKGRADLLLELGRLRVLRGIARSGTGQSQPGRADLVTGIHELESLLPTGAADVYDSLAQALLMSVPTLLGAATKWDGPESHDAGACARMWDRCDQRHQSELLSLIRSALLNVRSAVLQHKTFPAYVVPKLRALDRLLAPAAQRKPSADDPSITSIIGDILRHS